MPTKNEVIAKVGTEMWDKMCETGWLDCITVVIDSALCECKCEKCGAVKNIQIGPPFDSNTQPNCDCGRWKGMHIEKIVTCETDIPQSDIDRAYRAANNEYVDPMEWD